MKRTTYEIPQRTEHLDCLLKVYEPFFCWAPHTPFRVIPTFGLSSEVDSSKLSEHFDLHSGAYNYCTIRSQVVLDIDITPVDRFSLRLFADKGILFQVGWGVYKSICLQLFIPVYAPYGSTSVRELRRHVVKAPSPRNFAELYELFVNLRGGIL